MRTLAILSVALLLALSLSGQGWQLIHPDKQYLFKLNSTDSILQVVRTDSLSIIGNDTLYHLNRLSLYNVTLDQYHNFQPNLIGTEVMKSSSSYLVYRNGWHTLNFNDTINSSWLYDTTNNVSATIASINASTTFNEPDSVMQIVFTNGTALLISKRFGALAVPLPTGDTARLAGIKDTVVHGAFLPGFKNMLNLHTGDVLMYEFGAADGTQTWGVPDQSFGLMKTTVTNREDYGDSVVYSVHTLYRSNIHTYGGGPYWQIEQQTYDKQLAYTKQQNDFEDAIPYTLYPITGSYLDGFYRNDLSGQWHNPTLYRTVDVFNSTQGNIKSVTGSFALNEGSEFDTIVPAQSFGIIFEKLYLQDVGLTHYYFMPFEQDYHIDLVGWIKDGVATGTIYPDYNIISTLNDQSAQPVLNIFPNPCSNVITINAAENFDISLADIIGRQLTALSVKANVPTTFEVNNFPEGIYVMHFKGSKGIFTRYIIVSR